MSTGQIAGAEQKRANYFATSEEKSFLEQLLPLLGRERMMPVQPLSKRPMSTPDRHQPARFPVLGAPESTILPDRKAILCVAIVFVNRTRLYIFTIELLRKYPALEVQVF